jgi:hypothetical protein
VLTEAIATEVEVGEAGHLRRDFNTSDHWGYPSKGLVICTADNR